MDPRPRLRHSGLRGGTFPVFERRDIEAVARDRHQVMTICEVGMFVLVSGGLLIGLL